MKKYADMNKWEKLAYVNAKNNAIWHLGGWYNCIMDNIPDCIPDTIEEAKQIVYEATLTDWCDGHGSTFYNAAPKELRFAGEAFIREAIDRVFAKEGDTEEIAEVKAGWRK